MAVCLAGCRQCGWKLNEIFCSTRAARMPLVARVAYNTAAATRYRSTWQSDNNLSPQRRAPVVATGIGLHLCHRKRPGQRTASPIPACSATKRQEFPGKADWLPLEDVLWEIALIILTMTVWPNTCESKQGTEADAMDEGTAGAHSSWAAVSPPWKIMLLSDGSVTRHLQLLTSLHVVADCVEMANIGEHNQGLPKETMLFTGPLVQRQVFLREDNEHGQAHVYAASWWDASQINRMLSDSRKPIWVSLSEGRTELYREIKSLYYGHSEELERCFSCKGPFWARHYLFWHNGKPLTLIYEVFSTSLERYLGPADLTAESQQHAEFKDAPQI